MVGAARPGRGRPGRVVRGGGAAARRPQAAAAPAGRPNPADDTTFTGPLARDLRSHVDLFAKSMPRGAAVAWVYMTVLVAWAEDHALIGPWLRTGAKAAREEFLAIPAGGMRGWLARAMASLAVHPGTWSLLDPKWTPLREGVPPEGACRDLAGWWDSSAPGLAYDVSDGPGSITGWVPGDLLQHLSDDRRKGNALVQTPWWVCDLILDKTLVPAAGEFTGEPLRVIDPACGTGHFLIRAVSYLWEWYTTGSLAPRQAKSGAVTGGTPLRPGEAVRRIIAGVHGCDKDPLTTAVARLRYTVAAGDLMRQSGLITGPLRLDRIPPFQVPVIPGDSLLAKVDGVSARQYAELHPQLAAIVNLGTSPEGPRQEALSGLGEAS